MCLIIVSLMGCEDSDLILPGFGKSVSKNLINTIKPGTILSLHDTIPLSLDADIAPAEKPDSILIRIYDMDPENDGRAVFESTLNESELTNPPLADVELPPLKDSTYQMVMNLSSKGFVTRKESVLFFISQFKPVLSGITVHPLSLVPGGDGILELVGTFPERKDAYVRWYAGNECLKAGMLSEGLGTLLVRAPASEGLFEYSAEIFPRPPRLGMEYSFRSPVSATTRVVVSAKYTSDSYELGPPAAFSHLFHFQGNIEDHIGGEPLTVRGERNFDYQAGRVGYRIGPISGLIYPHSLNPAWGALFPAQLLHVRMVPLALESGKIFRSVNADGISGFEMLLNEKKELMLNVWGENLSHQLSTKYVLNSLKPVDMQLGFGRNNQSIQVLLLIDGEPIASESISYPITIVGNTPGDFKGSSSFAGMGAGMSYLMDELGIYASKPSVDDAYRLAMEYRYGKDLNRAQAFSLGVLNSDILAKGAAHFEQDGLAISPGSSVSFTIKRTKQSAISFDVGGDFLSQNQSWLVSLIAAGNDPIMIKNTGLLSQGAHSQSISFSAQETILRFSLEPSEKDWALVFAGKECMVHIDPQAPWTLKIEQRKGANTDLLLSHLLVTEISADTSALDP